MEVIYENLKPIDYTYQCTKIHEDIFDQVIASSYQSSNPQMV